MISYKVLIILTFTINISHGYTYSKEEYEKEIDICVECLETVGFTRELAIINYCIAMEYVTGAGFVNFDTQINNTLEDYLNKIKEEDYHSLMNKQMLINNVYSYYNQCEKSKLQPNVLSPWDYCKECIVEKDGWRIFLFFKIIKCEWAIKKSFYENIYSNIILSFDTAKKNHELSKDTSKSNTSKDTGKNDTPSTSKDTSKSNTSKDTGKNDTPSTSKDTSKSNTSKEEAELYFQYILSVIRIEASKYAYYLPRNWCELNIPKLMDLLDLKSATESNKTIEVNH